MRSMGCDYDCDCDFGSPFFFTTHELPICRLKKMDDVIAIQLDYDFKS